MREKITVGANTAKGKIIYAKSLTEDNFDWILLISHTVELKSFIRGTWTNDIEIYTHLAVCCSSRRVHILQDVVWGRTKRDGFEYYESTEAEIKEIKQILRENNKKYVKILNRVIDR